MAHILNEIFTGTMLPVACLLANPCCPPWSSPISCFPYILYPQLPLSNFDWIEVRHGEQQVALLEDTPRVGCIFSLLPLVCFTYLPVSFLEGYMYLSSHIYTFCPPLLVLLNSCLSAGPSRGPGQELIPAGGSLPLLQPWPLCRLNSFFM